MIECPKCFNAFAGAKCSCGYAPPRAISFPGERSTNPEAALTESSRRWLEARGIHKVGMTRAEKTRANLDYIKWLQKTPKPGAHDWAYQIMEDIADGVCVSPYAEACAREIVGDGRTEERAAA